MEPSALVTAIATKGGEQALSAVGKFGVEKLKGFFEKGRINVALEDVLQSKGGQEAVRIAVDYMKANNGIPNEDSYKLLKALLVRLWNSKEDKEVKRLGYYAEIVAGLSPLELDVLVHAYMLSKQQGFRSTEYVGKWIDKVLESSDIKHTELVDSARESLTEKRLLARTTGDKSLFLFESGQNLRNALTELGYAIFESVYEDIKSILK